MGASKQDGDGVNTIRPYIIWACALAGLAAAGYVLWPRVARSAAEREAVAAGRTVVTYWDRHAGHEHESRMRLMDEFNRGQDEIYVRGVPVGLNALMEKFLTATAGNAPPDICSLDAAMIAQLAPQGLFLPLDALAEKVPALHEEAFFTHAWETVCFDGHLWALPTTTDIYCLVWNKHAFRRAGLDPERPPKTIAELEDYAARLTLRDASGSIEQMGFLPWLPWDHTFFVGALFGGDWYNPATGHMELSEQPNILASLAWQQSFTIDPESDTNPPYAMDVERIAAFSKNIGDYASANNPFYSGMVAMMIEGEWQVTFIPKYAPGLDWGVAPVPQPEGAPPVAFGPTCIADVIPATAREPEAAMKFLAWFHAPRPDGRPSPSSDYNHVIHNIPCRPEEAQQERFIGDPKFRVFVEQVIERPVAAFPVTPATQFMADQIERFREQVTYRKMSPKEAARELETVVNRELDRVAKLLERRQAT